MQESKLYYDPDLACYLQYDHEKKKYSVHSRLKLPPSREKSKEVVEISSDEEGEVNNDNIMCFCCCCCCCF